MLDQVLEIFNIKPEYDLDIMKENQSLSYITTSVLDKVDFVLKAEKPDIVHSHASMSAKIAAKMLGIKSIYTRHTVAHITKAYLKTFPGKQINGFINSFLADRIIAVAKAAADNIINTGVPEDKIEIVLNGADPLDSISDERKAQVRAEYGIGDDEVVFAIVARLEKVKGHEFYIRAARKIIEKDIKAKFFICGVGEEESVLKALAKDLGIENNIIFTGFIKNVYEILNINKQLVSFTDKKGFSFPKKDS
jgi:UDP-N-acetylglucosamine 2-epimerase